MNLEFRGDGISDTDPNGDGDPADGVPIATTVTDLYGDYDFCCRRPVIMLSEQDLLNYISDDDLNGAPTDNWVTVVSDGMNDNTGNDFLDDTSTETHAISGVVYDDGFVNDNTFSADDTVIAG